jgi:hypothetical protein
MHYLKFRDSELAEMSVNPLIFPNYALNKPISRTHYGAPTIDPSKKKISFSMAAQTWASYNSTISQARFQILYSTGNKAYCLLLCHTNLIVAVKVQESILQPDF